MRAVFPAALPEPFVWAASFAFGLVLGSFANVCIARLPEDLSVVSPGSRCPHCATPLRAWQNIPVVSFLLLRGRCATCRARISARYPLVEAANGLLYVGLAAQFGANWPTLARMLLVTALLVLALIDAEHYLLPDAVTLPGIAAGLAVSFLPGWSVPPLEALLSALGGYAVFWFVAAAWEKLRGVEALGQGDWKMAAMLGAFFGWQQLLLVVFLASLAGTVFGLAGMALHGHDSQKRLPLGTFLALGAVAAVFAGEPVLRWYRDLWRV